MTRGRIRRPRSSAGIVALVLGVALPSCRDATQIVLRIHGDVSCAAGPSWRGVAVKVGEPGDALERQAPSVVTPKCEPNGDFGSVVVVPSGEKDDEVGIVVVAGVLRDPEECLAASYAGCIVARRALRFAPHGTLNVDVELVPDCLNIGCSASQTCVRGACVDSRDPDLGADAGSLPEAATVRCGSDGLRCPTEGAVCCLTVDVDAGTSQGECKRPELCVNPSIVLRCDDDSDCPRGGNGEPPLCALSYVSVTDNQYIPMVISHSTCRLGTYDSLQSGFGLGLCEERAGCVDSRFMCLDTTDPGTSVPNLLPSYHWCRLAF